MQDIIKRLGLEKVVPGMWNTRPEARVEQGHILHAVGEEFVGKTIATSELYYQSGIQPGYWFLTFTDGTRLIVGTWSGNFLGESLNFSYLGDMADRCPFFFSEDEITLIQQAEEERRRRYVEEAKTSELTRLASGGDHPYMMRGAHLSIDVVFADGEKRHVEGNVGE